MYRWVTLGNVISSGKVRMAFVNMAPPERDMDAVFDLWVTKLTAFLIG